MRLAALCGNLARPPGGDRSRIAGDNGVVRKMLSQLPGNDLRLHRFVHPAAIRFHESPPLPHTGLRALQKAAMFVAPEQRNQPLQSSLRIADESDFYRVSQSDSHRIEFNLNCARLSRFREEFDVRKRCSYHQEGVAIFHCLLRRLRSQETDAPGRVWT